MAIPRPEPPHGSLGAVKARRGETSSMSSVQASRTKVAVPTVQTPTKPSRKKPLYASRQDPKKTRR
jgi:hypothetical protein